VFLSLLLGMFKKKENEINVFTVKMKPEPIQPIMAGFKQVIFHFFLRSVAASSTF
jgi:hypothetical protein